jgi:hypothetical protein
VTDEAHSAAERRGGAERSEGSPLGGRSPDGGGENRQDRSGPRPPRWETVDGTDGRRRDRAHRPSRSVSSGAQLPIVPGTTARVLADASTAARRTPSGHGTAPRGPGMRWGPTAGVRAAVAGGPFASLKDRTRYVVRHPVEWRGAYRVPPGLRHDVDARRSAVPALQAGGHRFDPGWLHFGNPCKRAVFAYGVEPHSRCDLSSHSSFAQVAQRIAARSRADRCATGDLAATGRMTTLGSSVGSSRRAKSLRLIRARMSAAWRASSKRCA